MSKYSDIIMVFFILTLLTLPLIGNIVSANSGNSFPYESSDEEIVNALNYLRTKQSSDGNIGGLSISAWASMAITAAGNEPKEWGNLVNYLKIKTPLLDPNKATDWERHTLAIVACNEDPTNFYGIDFIEKIIGFFDGTQIGSTSILYDDFFGIISLISAGIDKDEPVIQNTKSFIINQQKSNGGWGDADSTSAAIMALISSGENKNSPIINNAISFLKTLQGNDGGFKSWGITNSASTSWAVMAINAVGKNPTSDEWNINGNNPISYLISLQQEDGSFNWSIDQNINSLWMTSYIIPALLGKFYPVKVFDSGNNNPPNKPKKPSGPSEGKVCKSYSFETYGFDPDKDKIQYRFDWDADGDHCYSSWTPLKKTGNKILVSNKWAIPGTFLIKCQSKDELGLISDWSDGHKIIIKEFKIWSGEVRIEGKNNTIWNGNVIVDETYFYAKNMENGKIEYFEIKYPNILGALCVAANKGVFSISIEYFPDSDRFFIKSIADDSDWWHYWVDFEIIQNSVNKYKLTDKDDKILIGYLESLDAHALIISKDKKNVKKNEEFTIFVCNESGSCVENASVNIGSKNYFTDSNGNVTIKFSNTGNLIFHSEKDGFIRSKKEIIKIFKDVEIAKPIKNSLYIYNYKIKENLKKTLIIGAIDIEVKSTANVEKVEFYINDNLEYTDEERPFEYRVNKRYFFKQAEITVKSYNCKNFTDIIKNLIIKIKELFVKNEIKLIFDEIYKTKNEMLHNKYNSGDCDNLKLIIINILPNFQKILIDKNII